MDRIIVHEFLEGVTGHDREVELPIPMHRREVAKDPLDVRPLARLTQHAGRGIESAQPSRMSRLPCHAQQCARPTADIECRPR